MLKLTIAVMISLGLSASTLFAQCPGAAKKADCGKAVKKTEKKSTKSSCDAQKKSDEVKKEACEGCEVKKALPECKSDAKEKKEAAKLCDKCGEEKGNKKCCDPKAEKCKKCGLNKGSSGCCNDKKEKEDKNKEEAEKKAEKK
jgi:hypothetical protein